METILLFLERCCRDTAGEAVGAGCIPTTVNALDHCDIWLCTVRSCWANSSLRVLSVYLCALHAWVCARTPFLALLHYWGAMTTLCIVLLWLSQGLTSESETGKKKPKQQRNTCLQMKFRKCCVCPNPAGRCGSSMPAEQWSISFKSWSMYFFFYSFFNNLPTAHNQRWSLVNQKGFEKLSLLMLNIS